MSGDLQSYKWFGLAAKHARRSAARYGASYDDLFQEAALAAEDAQRKWREDGGAGLMTYVWRAVSTTVAKEAVRQVSPVSASPTCAQKLFDFEAVRDVDVAANAAPADVVLDEHVLISRVRDVVMDAGGEAAYRALLCDVSPRDMVDDAKDRRSVYDAVKRAKYAIETDGVLRKIAQDMGLQVSRKARKS